MARKFCPKCNHLCGGSATDCSKCGHVFDASTIVVTPKKVPAPTKRCLMCGAPNPLDAQTCLCGEHFDDATVDEIRDRLRYQRTKGVLLVIVGLAGVAGLIAVFWIMQFVWPWLLGLAGLLAFGGVVMVLAANQRLAALPLLPRATLRPPRD